MSIAAKLVLLLACLVAGFGGGVKWHAGQDAIEEQARQVNQRATERMQRQNSNTAALGHEADKVKIRTEFKTITEEVERVVTQIEYRDRACLDAGGLHAINAAIARVNGDSGKPLNQLPTAAASP
jgi:uncharacterized protein HemX